jgi:hypothetical protein
MDLTYQRRKKRMQNNAGWREVTRNLLLCVRTAYQYITGPARVVNLILLVGKNIIS